MSLNESDVGIMTKVIYQIRLRNCLIFVGSMVSTRISVFIVALLSVSVPCFCAPRGTALRQQVKDMTYPTSSDSGLGEYERKTQSPMIWINLHKTDLSSSADDEAMSRH